MTCNRIACLAAFVLLMCANADAANYRVAFDATWSAQNHPNAIAPGAHFSTPVGATHNAAVGFWAPGELASPGIERVAETGNTVSLLSEIATATAAGNAFTSTRGGTFNSPGTAFLGFEAIADYPLVTLVSMIAPSPDWFVGVHGLELRDENGWIREIVVPLAPYDAGTEAGEGLSTANPASNPLETIRRLDTDPSSILFESQPFGTFTFELLPLCDVNFDGQCNVADLSSQDGLYSVGDLQAGVPVVIGENSKFDLNEDNVVNSEDLDLWLADAADQNGFAEPYLKGDTNLNDHVGFGDFTSLSGGFAVGREWSQGNYDGSSVTDFGDFLSLSQNFGKSINRKPAPASVPEPSGSMLLLMALATAAAKRHVKA